MANSARLFALSDHHFGHQNIIKYCNRDSSLLESQSIGLQEEIHFQDLTAADDAKLMILAHNSVVQDDDIVIFGGDVSASRQGRKWLKKIVAKLKGRKILIRGNHDHLSDAEYQEMGFEMVADFLKIGKFAFCHYPDIPKIVDICQREGLTLCCGHTHKVFPDYQDGVKRINLGVDVQGRTPLLLGNFEEIKNSA